jgi:hypothetical protein
MIPMLPVLPIPPRLLPILSMPPMLRNKQLLVKTIKTILPKPKLSTLLEI